MKSEKQNIVPKQWKVVSVLIALFCCAVSASVLTWPLRSAAEVRPDLQDDFLQNQCDWAMFLDVQDIQRYLNYKGSQLHPLARVRISFRQFPRNGRPNESQPAQVYEELWYYDGMPIGLRRRSMPKITRQSVGIILLGSFDEARGEHARSLANGLVRLLVDLQFREALVSLVRVPELNYDGIAGALNHYHFVATNKVSQGQQMSVHLSSDPVGKDEYFFLLK